MHKARAFFYVCASLLCLPLAVPVLAEEVRPQSLTCTANAKAWRAYDDSDQRWEAIGWKATGKTTLLKGPFGVSTSRHSADLLRDKVFSKLDTDTPTVRSITRAYGSIGEHAAEYQATVLLRATDHVVLTWSNGGNMAWMAMVDLKQKKAVVTHVAKGIIASVEGEIETLDCR